MTKFFLLPLFLLSLTPTYAAGPPKRCPAFTPSKDKAKWTWMDRDCHIRTRAELDRILRNHRVWLHKYNLNQDDRLSDIGREVLRDPLRADLSGGHLEDADLTGAILDFAGLSGAVLDDADLTDAWLVSADLTDAKLKGSDLTGAHLEKSDLTGADLDHADLTQAELNRSDLIGAKLTEAYLIYADLSYADLTDADLYTADLTGADLIVADLTGAFLDGADLTGAEAFQANLAGARLGGADLTGARFEDADLAGAGLDNADMSSSYLLSTDLSDADLTGAKLWYADFEHNALPPVNGIARAEGLETLRWGESFDELDYPLQLKDALNPNYLGPMPPLPSLPRRWLLWLVRYRERLEGKTNGWLDDFAFLWSDIFHGLQLKPSKGSKSNPNAGILNSGRNPEATRSPGTEERSTVAQNEFPLLDLRNALRQAGYTEAELQVNLSYKRHTQSTLGMILYDWTCEYGAAPLRPLIIALVIAALTIPIYWLGFRHRWFGSQLLRVEKQCEKEVETLLGDAGTRPNWRGSTSARSTSNLIEPKKRMDRLRRQLVSIWPRLCGLAASCWPRLRWEASFFKAVVIFSLISIVSLGFEGLDFGRWVRNLTFHEYDLKARGWLRTVSGFQSLVGLGLLALSLLSFFGHPFE